MIVADMVPLGMCLDQVEFMHVWVALGSQKARSGAGMAIITVPDFDEADLVWDIVRKWRFPAPIYVDGAAKDGKRFANVKWFDDTYAARKAEQRAARGPHREWRGRSGQHLQCMPL